MLDVEGVLVIALEQGECLVARETGGEGRRRGVARGLVGGAVLGVVRDHVHRRGGVVGLLGKLRWRCPHG